MFQQLEAGHARHLDVEEEEVGRELRDHRQCFFAAAGFAGNLDFGVLGEQPAQLQTGEAFIVDDQSFHTARGMITVATTRPSPFWRSSCARSPKRMRSRSRVLLRPTPAEPPVRLEILPVFSTSTRSESPVIAARIT